MSVTLVKSSWSSGNLVFQETVAGNGAAIHFGINGTGLDIKFFGATSGAYMLWDESADKLIFDKADIKLGDNDYMMWGDATGGDVSARWTGSILQFLPATDDTGSLDFGNGTKDIDVKIFLGSASEYVLLDVGNSKMQSTVPLDIDNAIDLDHALSAAGEGINVAVTINHATADAEGLDVSVVQ